MIDESPGNPEICRQGTIGPNITNAQHVRKQRKEMRMMVGDPAVFAIESGITEAYLRPSLMALGYFVIHVSGKSFGVKLPDATLLACSFDEVGRRIADRGSHTPPFPFDMNAAAIANAFIRAGYAVHDDSEHFFEMPSPQFRNVIRKRRLEWAPDGDAAFDDGSYVLQFDLGDKVRLIAYVSTPDYLHDPETLREISLNSEDFYGILQNWHDLFEDEWKEMPKVLCQRKVFQVPTTQ